MKNLFTALVVVILLLFNSLYTSSQNSNLVTQLKVFDTDTTFRYYYFYDSNNNKALEIKYFFEDNQWKRLNQTEWIYNDNKCITQREKIYKNSDWVINYEINYTYADGLLISERHSKFLNGMEQDYKLTTLIYDNNLVTLRRDFIYESNKWLLTKVTENVYQNESPETTIIKKIGITPTENQDLKLSFEYYPNGMLMAQTLTIKNTENEWINQQKTVWYYTSTGKVSSQRTKNWNANLSKWENESMIEYSYNGDGSFATETYYYWKSMFWERVIKYNYLYNNGNLTKKLMQMPIYRQWRDFSSIDYNNFTNNKANQMETKLTFWGDNGALLSTNIPFVFNNEIDIKKGNQIIISYEKIDNTDISTYSFNNNMQIRVYPNPSEDVFYFNPEEYDLKSWTVFDMNGKVVLQNLMTEKSGVIDLSNVTKGIYLLQVITPNNILSQKLVRK